MTKDNKPIEKNTVLYMVDEHTNEILDVTQEWAEAIIDDICSLRALLADKSTLKAYKLRATDK